MISIAHTTHTPFYEVTHVDGDLEVAKAFIKENHLKEARIMKGHSLGPVSSAASKRPLNFRKLDGRSQWAIDKRLGILDWDGDPEK
jgi:hypothetical protein